MKTVCLLSIVLFAVFAVFASAHQSEGTCGDRSQEEDNAYHQSFGNVDYDSTKVKVMAPQAISRHAVMSCARDWVRRKVPYCQCNGPAECCGHCPYCGTTRCDCSGYVSHCWGLSHGLTTQTLPGVSHRISKHELKHGDIMLFAAEHVIIFGGWENNATKTHYHAFQEPGCHTNGPHHAYESVVPYPNSWSPSSFVPYRYNHIVD